MIRVFGNLKSCSIFKNIEHFSKDIEFYKNIKSMDQSTFKWPWKDSSWDNLDISRDSFIVFGTESGKNITCFSVFKYSDSENLFHLLKIMTLPAYRGKGFGKSHLQYCIDYFSNFNSNIYLEVEVENRAAIILYEAMNFQRLRKLKKFYSDGSDAYSYLWVKNGKEC